jgi:molybdenum cofactor cytidylyltransferase
MNHTDKQDCRLATEHSRTEHSNAGGSPGGNRSVRDRNTLRVGALVLATPVHPHTGQASALVSVGGRTALARVLTSLRAAGVEQPIVVTGHQSDDVARAADALAAQAIHDRRWRSGPASSLEAGIAALPPGLEAYFVASVSHPLVNASVFTACLETFGAASHETIYPCCAGLRGSTVLLRTGLPASALGAATLSDPLRLPDKKAAQVVAVETEDLTVLMDVDSAASLERVDRLVGLMEAIDMERMAAIPWTPVLAETDALYILRLLQTPDRVLAHCHAVAAVGTVVATAVLSYQPSLDVDLVRTACLLHDMVRTQGARKHAVMAERILRNLRLTRLAEVVGAHMVLPLDPASTPGISEEELVYLADKWVIEDRPEGLTERESAALAKYGVNADACRRIRARMQAAEIIAAKVEAAVGRPIEDLLAAAGPAG